VTVSFVPTTHTVSLLGLVMCGLKTSRRARGLPWTWTSDKKNETHRIVKVSIIKSLAVGLRRGLLLGSVDRQASICKAPSFIYLSAMEDHMTLTFDEVRCQA
jgi:hypothetical protein